MPDTELRNFWDTHGNSGKFWDTHDLEFGGNFWDTHNKFWDTHYSWIAFVALPYKNELEIDGCPQNPLRYKNEFEFDGCPQNVLKMLLIRFLIRCVTDAIEFPVFQISV